MEMSREDFLRLQGEDVFKKPISKHNGNMNESGSTVNKNGNLQADSTPLGQPDGFIKNNRGNGLNLLNLLNFKNFKIDADRSVVLAVLLLLSNESDELLLLALLYIIL